MFAIRYERIYMGHVDSSATPPEDLIHSAENQVAFLHPTRSHVLVCSEANLRFMKFGTDVPSSIGWRIYFTPQPNAAE